jgi:citrate lyase beta subunit
MTIRSLLFVPGARPERFDKAMAAGADMVCIDLEDAVPPDQKAAARATTLAWLAAQPIGAPVGLRINGLGTIEGLRDLVALAESRAHPTLLMLPKAGHAEEIRIVRTILGEKTPPLWPIVESASALKAAWDIVAAPGVEGVLFGGADYSADLGVAMDWEPLFLARSTLAAACANAGAQLLDVPHIDVKDDAGLDVGTRRVKALGFTGRACIHPSQVSTVNQVFSPTDAEIAQARRVLEAFAAAGGAAALLDGKLIEAPVIRSAERVLARASLA